MFADVAYVASRKLIAYGHTETTGRAGHRLENAARG